MISFWLAAEPKKVQSPDLLLAYQKMCELTVFENHFQRGIFHSLVRGAMNKNQRNKTRQIETFLVGFFKQCALLALN